MAQWDYNQRGFLRRETLEDLDLKELDRLVECVRAEAIRRGLKRVDMEHWQFLEEAPISTPDEWAWAHRFDLGKAEERATRRAETWGERAECLNQINLGRRKLVNPYEKAPESIDPRAEPKLDWETAR